MNHVLDLPNNQQVKLYYSARVYNPKFSSFEVPLIAAQFASSPQVYAINTLDLACGTGFAGIILKKMVPQVKISFCDVDPEAVRVTKLNIKRNGLEAPVFEQDLLPKGVTYHIVMANLPTFDAEDMAHHPLHGPKIAYKAGGQDGKDGLSLYKTLFKQAEGRVGVLVCECQPKYQKELVDFAKKQGWSVIFISGDAFAFMEKGE